MQPTLLFWTGGWDSTFRLCQLVIDQRAAVQPVYVQDRRRSRTAEMLTMARLREMIFEYPQAARLLMPTRFVDCVDLPRGHRRQNRATLARFRLGLQYDQLSRCCELMASDVEIGIEKPHRPRDRRHVQAWFVLSDLVDRCTHGLREPIEHGGEGLRRLFVGMRFPLIDLTKADMLAVARRGGYDRVILETWTCLTPIRTSSGHRIGCGRCRPCRLRIAKCRLMLTLDGIRLRKKWSSRVIADQA